MWREIRGFALAVAGMLLLLEFGRPGFIRWFVTGLLGK